jgi:hypothetical protein
MLLYMCPHTSIRSRFESTEALLLLYMCPRTTAYYYICVLKLVCLQVPRIRSRFKSTEGLLRNMLDNFLHVQSLIVQKTKLIDDCAHLLMSGVVTKPLATELTKPLATELAKPLATDLTKPLPTERTRPHVRCKASTKLQY